MCNVELSLSSIYNNKKSFSSVLEIVNGYSGTGGIRVHLQHEYMMQHEEVEGKGDEGQVKNIFLQEKTYCRIFL